MILTDKSYGTLLIGLMIGVLGLLPESIYAQEIPVFGYQVVNVYPHDPKAFTQGLIYKNGYLYETTGKYGHSTLRKVELETGEVLKLKRLPGHVFAEGLTDWGDRLIGITWKERLGFDWDIDSFEVNSRFRYASEGWGLTHDGEAIILSDGSPVLRFMDPNDFSELRRIRVTANGRRVWNLNELEWYQGEILANIWLTDNIARINPETGEVTGWIDLSGLLRSQGRVRGRPDVLNGIAVAEDGRLWVTGKLWPKLFEITLIPPQTKSVESNNSKSSE